MPKKPEKTLFTFEDKNIKTMLISGAALEDCTTHSVAGHSVRDGAPQTGPSAFAPTAESLPA